MEFILYFTKISKASFSHVVKSATELYLLNLMTTQQVDVLQQKSQADFTDLNSLTKRPLRYSELLCRKV